MSEKLAETWWDHLYQIKDAKRRVDRYQRARIGDLNIQRIVEREVAGGIKSELQEIQSRVEIKTLKELHSFISDDLSNPRLTELEKKVLAERLKTSNFAEIDRRLNLPTTSAYKAYFRAIHKINREEVDEPHLSKQQMDILALTAMGMSSVKIAHELNTSEQNVRKQLSLARKKMT